jgi:hypothetical protein
MIRQSAGEQGYLPELYIFVTSPRPDPYVNVLMHLFRNRPVSAINYVALIEHDYTSEQMAERLSDIEADVGHLLDELARGFYAGNRIELDSAWSGAYRECRVELDRIPVQRLSISWDDLDSELLKFLRGAPVMFDVTTLKKNLLVDVVALLLSRGWTNIYSFELVTSGQPQYDDKGLIHALGPTGFRYRSLAESKHVEKARSRIVSRSITFRTFFIVTAGVAFTVFIIEVLFANTILASGILIIATIASIVGVLFPLVRKDS